MSKLTSPTDNEKRVIAPKHYVYGIVIALLVFVLDQLSKIWIESTYKLHETTIIIKNLLSCTYVVNKGAAWSILSGQIWLLLIISIIVLIAIIKFFRYLTDNYVERSYAIFLMIGGILGNSTDRLWRGAVVDFIDVHWKQVWQYPIFNIADIAICCAVGIFIFSNLLRKPDKKETSTPEDTPKDTK